MALFILVEIATGELRIVQASEIIAKVENSEAINYSYVRIEGDLNLNGPEAGVARHIESPIRITDSIILNSTNLNNINFDGSVDFERIKFLGPAAFIRAKFNGPANFDNSLFDEGAIFGGAVFDAGSNFLYTKFNKSTNFLGASFKGEAIFYFSIFNGQANFNSVTFEDNALFSEASFIKSASFRQAQFGSSNFRGSRFNDDVDFDSAQFNKPADFTGANFKKMIYFNKVKFNLFLINWNNIKNGLVSDGPFYLLLIKNFKDVEQFEDADNCYYQYRDKKREDGPLGWGKFLDYISWLSCGYGVRWHHPILSGIALALLFGLYYESYCLRRKAANFLHKQEPKNPCKYDSIQNLKKNMSFSVMLLLSLPPEWSRYGRDEFVKFVTRHWFSSILERLIGWGLILLLVGTLTRLMVRY